MLIQQRSATSQTETGVMAVRDERIAVVLPVVEFGSDAVLFSPDGKRWNVISDAQVRRGLNRVPVYAVCAVRRAKEGDRRG